MPAAAKLTGKYRRAATERLAQGRCLQRSASAGAAPRAGKFDRCGHAALLCSLIVNSLVIYKANVSSETPQARYPMQSSIEPCSVLLSDCFAYCFRGLIQGTLCAA
jgi:hypothetical protein